MLRQRIITGSLLALAAVLLIVASAPLVLVGVLAAATLVACWEWTDLAGLNGLLGRLGYCVIAAAVMAILFCGAGLLGAAPQLSWIVAVLGLAALWWLVALLCVTTFPASANWWGSIAVRALIGWLVLLPAWFAFAYLRGQAHGEWLILFMLTLVAAADIGAYFSGTYFGRNKLAPAVSPGKSWEGFCGGLASSVLFAVAVWWFAASQQFTLGALLAVAVATVLASILGDLAESMVKRFRGVKDSGNLLPGHGGVMDRLDSISAAAPVFALGLLLDEYIRPTGFEAIGLMKAVAVKNVTVLGATGSIGDSTLDVIGRHPDRYRVFALTANTGVGKLLERIEQFRPQYAVLRDAEAAAQLRACLRDKGDAIATEVLSGCEGLVQVAADPRADVVVAAIVGAAGLEPTMAAVRADKQILLANKEALVMAGHLFMAALAASKAVLLPVDSEHNAIFQCLPSAYQCGSAGGQRGLNTVGVRKILLTGSGGPFRNTPLNEFVRITPAQAIAHPNWSMGPKISVDSATMMNKGLELIEACWLFDAQPAQVQIVIHPQSVIHSMVEYQDGSILAQLGNPDMRTPIAHALAWPERIESGVGSLDLIAQARLDFQRPTSSVFHVCAWRRWRCSAAARHRRC